MKFADVTNDIAFRKIFGNENKKISLISFLNAVISFPGNNKVTEVEILNPYQLSKLANGKSTIVDVKARDNNGNTFIVEMQVADSDFFHKRILYYTSQSYVSQIGMGKEYHKLNPAYFIGILEFEISKNDSYKSCHKVLDVETNEHVIQDIEFNFIELPKFNKTIDQLESSVDQWTYFIKNAENLRVIPENVHDTGLREAYLEADKHSWSQAELDDYERASIKERDDIGRVNLAERRGLEKGLLKGQIEGKIEGKREGKREGIIEFARMMKSNAEPLEKIIHYTGLTREEIEKL
jgi:predicted transposase/invertase (TIGR01784 family)